MHFDEAFSRILDADSQLTERAVAVDQLSVEPDGVCTGEDRLHFADRGLVQLCGRFQHKPSVPVEYLASLPERMRTDLLRHHLAEGLQHCDGTITLYSRGDQLSGVGRSDLIRLPGRDVLEAVLDGTGGQADELEFPHFSIADESLHFDLVTHRAQREVRPGDIMRAGVSLRHSLAGEYATSVEGYVLRLRCANGATVRECVGARKNHRTRRLPAAHPGAGEQQRAQIRRLSADALEMINHRFDGVRRMIDEPADLAHLANNWLRRSRLSYDRLMPLLQAAHAEEGGENTTYGIMNAFTRVATHNRDLSPNIRNALARMAGLLAFGHSRICSKCWSLIAATN
jgi:hypothetical protein